MLAFGIKRLNWAHNPSNRCTVRFDHLVYEMMIRTIVRLNEWYYCLWCWLRSSTAVHLSVFVLYSALSSIVCTIFDLFVLYLLHKYIDHWFLRIYFGLNPKEYHRNRSIPESFDTIMCYISGAKTMSFLWFQSLYSIQILLENSFFL